MVQTWIKRRLRRAAVLSDWVLPLLGVSFVVIYFASGMANYYWPNMETGKHFDSCV